jgi:2-polyprenyl-3-methyl-5-hydroxy-6-metoxy-1,4-benzoquinol methylase
MAAMAMPENPATLFYWKRIMSANPKIDMTIPAEILERARRERDFFNQQNREVDVPDQMLRVPESMPEVPEEVTDYLPSLGGKTVCDVGCGYGLTSSYFALRGARVLGFDVAESNVSVAERAARVNGVIDRTEFRVMQAECLDLPSNSFDLVYGNAVLHHLDIAFSAREFFRVLKPGGAAVFREPLGENRLLEWARRSPWRSSRHRHTTDERSLRYQDVEVLRTVFPNVALRESELLAVLRAVFRKVEVGMVSVPRAEKFMNWLVQLDRSTLACFSALRLFASYCVVTMTKAHSGRPQR